MRAMIPVMWGAAMLVPDSTAYVFVGYEDRTFSPGATMSGFVSVVGPTCAGPRLLKPASALVIVVAPTVYDSSYWAGGPRSPIVSQNGPEFPAATTGTMPAARTFCTVWSRADWVHPTSTPTAQYHEL